MELMKVVVLFGIFVSVTSQTLQNAKDIYDHIFNDYRIDLRPSNNYSEPVNIQIGFYIVSINDFRETEETLVLTGGLFMNWTDVSLVWNPANYGGITSLQVNTEKIWTPLIYLANNAEKLEQIGSDSKFISNILFNGQVVYSPGGIIQAKCSTDLSKFPIDSQTCKLQFIPWSSSSSIVKLIAGQNEINLNFFSDNSDWDIKETSAYSELNDRGSGFYYVYETTLTIKRKPAYYVVMVILPTILLCLLNPLVFLLPVESGERISLAITILLSYAIFLTLVAASIPASSNPMCYLLVVMVIIMIISGMTVIATIISGYYYYKNPYSPGKIAKCLLWCFYRNKKVRDYNENSKKSVVTGRDMSNILDNIFLVCFYIVIMLLICSYLLMVVI